MTRRKRLTLPADATIASILDGLANPKEYVRFVLEKMHVERADQVRVSVCGSTANPAFVLDLVFEDEGYEHWEPFAGYRGASRGEMDQEAASRSADWSLAAMSLAQVRELMGILNNWKGAGLKPDV